MEWFNVFGLVFIVVIMIPNIVLQSDVKMVLKTDGTTQ